MRAALLAGLLVLTSAAPLATAQPRTTQISAADAVVATTVAAAATQAAEQRVADQTIRGLRANVDRLEQRVAAGGAANAELTAAREALIAELARRDAQYAQEIAVFRAAVQDIASTPEGVAILAERRPGNLRQARSELLALVQRRNAAEQRGSRIRQAANLRAAAAIALDDRTRGEATTQEVVALYDQVTNLDGSAHWDWIEISRLNVDAGNLDLAERAARRAAALAPNEMERSIAYTEIGDVLSARGDLLGAVNLYIQSLAHVQRAYDSNLSDHGLRRSLSIQLSRLGDVSLGVLRFQDAGRYYARAFELDRQTAQAAWSVQAARDLCVDGINGIDVFVAVGNLDDASGLAQTARPLCERLASDFATTWDVSQLGYLRWREANIAAARGDIASARRDLRELEAVANSLVQSDPTNHRVAIQVRLLELLTADLELLSGDRVRARSTLIAWISDLEGMRTQTGLTELIEDYIWLAQVRLALLDNEHTRWSALQAQAPRVYALADLSALDWRFIEALRRSASSSK